MGIIKVVRSKGGNIFESYEIDTEAPTDVKEQVEVKEKPTRKTAKRKGRGPNKSKG